MLMRDSWRRHVDAARREKTELDAPISRSSPQWPANALRDIKRALVAPSGGGETFVLARVHFTCMRAPEWRLECVNRGQHSAETGQTEKVES